MKIKLISAIFVPIFLAGCSTILDPNNANSDFSCEDPNQKYTSDHGVVCKTPRAVYESTHDAMPLTEADVPITLNDKEGNNERLLKNTPQNSMAFNGIQPVKTDSNRLAYPVRMPAQVMRIWFAPWIDRKDDLHIASYLYTEIQPRRWAFGDEEFIGRGLIIPTKQLNKSKSSKAATPVKEQEASSKQAVSTNTSLPEL